MNVRSLQKNVDSLQSLLCQFSHLPTAIAITETKLTDHSTLNIQLPHYNFVNINSRTNAGGVGFYILENKKYNILNFPGQESLDYESIWLELEQKQSNKSVILGSVYRHPRQDNVKFLEFMDEMLCSLNRKNCHYYILGDMNINLLQSNSKNILDYVNMLQSNFSFQLICQPTRVTDTSSTLIDHIYTNCLNANLVPGILLSDISDHFPVFCLSKMNTLDKNSKRPRKHCMKNFNLDNFRSEVFDNFSILPDENSTPSQLEQLSAEFIDTFKRLIDKHAPIRKLSRKQMTLLSKPWLSHNLLKSINHRNSLYKSHFISGSLDQKAHYKKYAKTVQRSIEEAKRVYYTNKFKESKSNSKETWKTIKSLISPKRNLSFPEEILNGNGSIVKNPLEITNCFNNYFVSIGNSLSSKLPNSDVFKHYVQRQVKSTVYLEPVSENELLAELTKININKAIGPDNIPLKFIKFTADIISPYLASLFSLCIKNGIFPSIFKIARVTPLHKAGDRKVLSNYRPISVLSSISKIFERLIYTRLKLFFDKHNVISDYQFGFREGCSTTHAVLDIMTSAMDDLENN
ncbi:uncharacterized protein LOC144424244 [Styela clava]